MRPDGSIQLTDQDRSALGLLVTSATEADLAESSLRFGHVVALPANEGVVVAPVTGRIARPPRVQLGASVKRGTPLLEILPSLDTPDRIAVSTQSAERAGQINAAEREVAKAEAEAARTRELTPHVMSIAKLQEAETAAATARARLEGLRNAHAASNRAQTQPVQVTAPMSGIVSALSVELGALVNKGDVLARLIAAGPVWVDVSMPPDDPVGDGYLLDLPGRAIAARLLAPGRLTDVDGTRHDRLVVDPPDASLLSPGSSVPVHVARGVSHGIVLSESALVPGVEGDTVFVETAPNVYTPRPIPSGRQTRRPHSRAVGNESRQLQGERLRSQLRNAEQ